MKVVSLYQPYAQLCVLQSLADPLRGEKGVETRSWRTSHRGLLAIHAAKNMPKWCRDLLDREPFKSVLARHGYHTLARLPRGRVLGTVHLMDVEPTDGYGIQVQPLLHGLHEFSTVEHAFGDYALGRFGWVLRYPTMFVEPVPALGRQQLWDWDPPPGLVHQGGTAT